MTVRHLYICIALCTLALPVLAEDGQPMRPSLGAFPHQQHQKALGGCTDCHSGEPGKIEQFGERWAHNTCMGCHRDSQSGPTDCVGCHTGI